jgi:hypothetical protein
MGLMPTPLGDLGLDFLDIAAEKLGDFGHGLAPLKHLLEVENVHLGPALA